MNEFLLIFPPLFRSKLQNLDIFCFVHFAFSFSHFQEVQLNCSDFIDLMNYFMNQYIAYK